MKNIWVLHLPPQSAIISKGKQDAILMRAGNISGQFAFSPLVGMVAAFVFTVFILA